jgi:pyruvate formate lyase activating enzyme
VLIGGLQKVSLIDFPGKISTVIFTQGCNFRCPFCHNASLVDPKQFGAIIPEAEVLAHLMVRKKKIDGVVLSGGEPTLQIDLKQFLYEVKGMEFCIKLDTNGSKPNVLMDLVDLKLVDFIAMDIKHDFCKYEHACKTRIALVDIIRSVDFIKNCGVDYEFRTTVIPGIHSENDIVNIAKCINGAKKFIIQEFSPANAMDEKLRSGKVNESIFSPLRKQELNRIRDECLKHVLEFSTRKL